MIEWKEQYNIGLRVIDKQHKALFETVDKLYTLSDDDKNLKEKLKAILYDFREYTQTHFIEEEALMQSIEYDKIQEHKELHKKIISSINKVLKNSSNLSVVKSKIKIISKRLFLNHIIKEDIKIKHFIDNHGTGENIYEIK